jgi:glycosyltransferase involved in cell wall biosynthesis
MMAAHPSRRISILELRSVRGTGGGPEKTILLGAERRDRERFDVTVCYIRDIRDDVFGIDKRAGVTDIDYVEVREKHSFDLGIWRELVRLVESRSIDIVHAHEYKTDLLAWLLGRRTNAVALATAHGWTGHSSRELKFYYPVDKRLLARFRRVIAVSSDIKNELVTHGGSDDRISVILNGIDPAAFQRTGRQSEARTSLNLGPDDVVIGAVGRVEPQKRFDLLVEALVPLFAARPRLRLVIAGDGGSRAEVEALASRLGVTDRCRFAGHRTDVALLHEAFDLFVQSSDYEGTPNAVLEAMAMNTPIVATDAGGTRELARDRVEALIVPIGDLEALTRAIVEALDAPDAAHERVVAARARVEGELSFEARTRRLEAVYSELMTPLSTP